MTHPYASLAYAQSFGAPFAPLALPGQGIHLLRRPIPGTDKFDAMASYPLLPLAENADLTADFAALKAQAIVSLVAVIDPFFHPSPEMLARQFTVANPFKEHFIQRFDREQVYSKHHRYMVRRSLKSVEMRVIDLAEHLDAWCSLYDALVAKHNITGIQAFPRSYFEALCNLSPITFGAFVEGELVGAHICFEYQGYGYSHLGASSELGYKLGATYGLYDFMLTHFKERGAKAFDLGGGAGAVSASAGLTFFKQGFSNDSVMCYLCGKIIDEAAYQALSAGKETRFFPAYRG